MYGFAAHPLLEFVASALGLVLGYVVATSRDAPLTDLRPTLRFAVLLVVAFFAISVFDHVAGMVAPLFSGATGASSVLGFLGGLVLATGLVGAYLGLRGQLSVHLQPRVVSIPTSAVAAESNQRHCSACSRPMLTSAAFCTSCGTRVHKSQTSVVGG
jgi:hypothetical protein